MKNIMIRAWEIAREGANKFGGKAVEYLSESMKIAWAESKGIELVKKDAEVKTSYGSKKHKSWVAKIVGSHPRWKYERKFLKAGGEHSNGFGGYVFSLEEGIYEVCDAGYRYFAKVKNGELFEVEEHEVLAA